MEDITQETKNKIALRRSMVRLVMSYAAMFMIIFITGWGLVWMGDRTLATAGLTTAGLIVAWWFAGRATEKRNKEE